MSDDQTPAKSLSQTRVEMTQLMRPHQANFRGNVHGGTLLSLMDEVAYACATQFSGSYCVTVAVDAVELIAPVRVGDLLKLVAQITHTGRTSMDIGITVTATDPREPSSVRLASRCSFTMVAVDEGGKPKPVPAVAAHSPEELRDHCEARLRRELRKRFHAELAAGVCEFEAAVEGGRPPV